MRIVYKKAVHIAKMTIDRAMRAIYGCPENFRESLATPTATFPEIVKGLLLRSIVLKLLKCVQNLKFVALPVPFGGTQKISAIPRYAPFSPKF